MEKEEEDEGDEEGEEEEVREGDEEEGEGEEGEEGMVPFTALTAAATTPSKKSVGTSQSLPTNTPTTPTTTPTPTTSPPAPSLWLEIDNEETRARRDRLLSDLIEQYSDDQHPGCMVMREQALQNDPRLSEVLAALTIRYVRPYVHTWCLCLLVCLCV